jgi:hypothetical protein
MSNVTRLPPSDTMTVQQAIDYVKQEADTLEDVIIIGYTKDKEIYLRSSHVSREWSLWLVLEMVDYIRSTGRHAK